MKKISCIVIAALFAASAYSQSLRVSFNGNRDFQLKVDGKTYNSTNYSGSDVVVNNLSGDHDVSVYKINKRGRSKKLSRIRGTTNLKLNRKFGNRGNDGPPFGCRKFWLDR